MTRQRLVGLYRLFFMVVGVISLGILYAGSQSPTFKPANFFSFFTIESNILAAFTFLVTGISALRTPNQDRFVTLRGFATLAMTITGIIYFLLLRGLEEELQIPVPWINTVLHYVLPVAMLADWIVVPPRSVSFRRSLLWVLFPVLFVPYSLIRGTLVNWYPYPFLNAQVRGYESIALTCVVLLVFVVSLAALLGSWTRITNRTKTL